jgi:hypothetical protein
MLLMVLKVTVLEKVGSYMYHRWPPELGPPHALASERRLSLMTPAVELVTKLFPQTIGMGTEQLAPSP